MIDDGVSGLLFDGTAEHLAQKISFYVENRDKLTEHGLSGKLRFSRNFSFESYCRNLKSLVNRMYSS